MSDLLISSLITGTLNIIATTIPSVVALVYAKRFLAVKRAHKATLNALLEIQFLKEVEKTYNRETGINNTKIRKIVNQEQNMYSGNLFTPSKLQSKIATYQEKVDVNPFMPD